MQKMGDNMSKNVKPYNFDITKYFNLTVDIGFVLYFET